jgi:hypothetical protein
VRRTHSPARGWTPRRHGEARLGWAAALRTPRRLRRRPGRSRWPLQHRRPQPARVVHRARTGSCAVAGVNVRVDTTAPRRPTAASARSPRSDRRAARRGPLLGPGVHLRRHHPTRRAAVVNIDRLNLAAAGPSHEPRFHGVGPRGQSRVARGSARWAALPGSASEIGRLVTGEEPGRAATTCPAIR